MKFILLILGLLLSSILFSQNDFTETDARLVVDTFFKGFHEGDTILLRSVMVENMVMHTAFTDREGNNRINEGKVSEFISAIGNRPENQKWDERLMAYKVEIDGNLAHVWTPYEFWLNDTFSHCGANAFTIVRTDDGWKILNIIDSRRRSDCSQH